MLSIAYRRIHTNDSENDATRVQDHFVSRGLINDAHMALVKAVIFHLDFRKPGGKQERVISAGSKFQPGVRTCCYFRTLKSRSSSLQSQDFFQEWIWATSCITFVRSQLQKHRPNWSLLKILQKYRKLCCHWLLDWKQLDVVWLLHLTVEWYTNSSCLWSSSRLE